MSVPTQNDCTGDYLLSKAATDNYRDNYDAIFGKKVTSAAEVVPIKKESKSMNSKMREEFEAWAALERWPLDHPMRHELLVAWQASREALVVELPHIGDYLDTYRQGTNREEYLDALCTSIQSAGVSVK